MKQLKLVTWMFVSASIFSSAGFAHASYKGEDFAVASKATAPYNWSGFYAGVNAGAVSHTMNITDTQATSFLATIQQVSNPSLTGGFQLGYRRQLDLTNVSGVYGLEFSANFSNSMFSKQYGSSFSPYQLDSSNKLNNLCLFEVIGGIAADRTLIFMTAGFSLTNISGTTTNVVSVPFFNSFSVNNKNIFGTTVGGGIEYGFTDRISARFKVDFVTPNSYTTVDNTSDSFQITNSIVQGTFGLNYKFG